MQNYESLKIEHVKLQDEFHDFKKLGDLAIKELLMTRNYKDIQFVAIGGQGAVLKGQIPTSGTWIAIKIMLPKLHNKKLYQNEI